MGNTQYGPPLTRDGELAALPDGSPNTDAQPPFLLRFSPKLFATEAPEVFEYHADTNRLSLRQGKERPWLRDHAEVQRAGDANQTWRYCCECKSRYCPDQAMPMMMSQNDRNAPGVLHLVRSCVTLRG